VSTNNNTGMFVGGTTPILSNSGLFIINTTAGPNATQVRIDSNTTLTGPGTLLLNANAGSLDTAYIVNNGATTLTQDVGHIIRGTGNLYVPLINNGIVRADVPGRTLQLLSTTKTNNNILTATNGATMQISGVAVPQGPSGQIIADGGTVLLIGDTITGGTISTLNGGTTRIPSGSGTFINVASIAGPFLIDNNNGLFVTGGLNHTGTITLNTTAGPNGTQIRFDNSATLSGNSSILLNANAGSLDTAYLVNNGPVTVTQDAGHQIHGTGNIYVGLINNGTIDSDVSGRTLQLLGSAKTNNNLITVSPGAAPQITNIVLTQGSSGRIVNTGGTVTLPGTTINGGTIESSAGGIGRVTGGSTTFTNLVNLIGPFTIDNNLLLDINGNLNHDDVITLNQTAGPNATQIRFNTTSSITGPGRIVLNANAGSLDTSYLINNGPITMTQTSGHLIRGTGNIYVPLINNGSIVADVAGRTLQLLNGAKTNNTTMTAVNGATLGVLNCTLTQAPGASMAATASNLSFSGATVNNGMAALIAASGAGNTITLASSTINGGSIESTGGATNRVTGGTTLANLTRLLGPTTIDNNSAMFLSGDLTHDAPLTVNTSAGPNGTQIRFDTSCALSGNTEIFLNANAGSLDTAYLINNGPSIVTQSAGHTIRGTGNIYVNVVNNGEIRADIAGRTLQLNSSPKTNNNLITAVNGSTLIVNTIAITQGAAGRIVNDASTLLIPCTINGGTIETINGGTTRINGSATLTNLASVTGPLTLDNNGAIFLSGNLNHDGLLTVNSTAGPNGTQIRVDSNSHFIGPGNVFLNGNPGSLDTAYLNTNGPVTLTNDAGHTISGRGNIYGNFVNNGIISPGNDAGDRTNLIRRQGNYTCGPTSQVIIDLDGTAQGDTYDWLNSTGTMTVDGSLLVRLAPGYLPPRNTIFTVVSGSSRMGQFSSVTLPNLPASLGYPRIEYTSNAVRVRIPLCPTDWNAMDGINSQDFFDFLSDFFAGTADFNFDGFVNSQDFFDFLTSFFGGCAG